MLTRRSFLIGGTLAAVASVVNPIAVNAMAGSEWIDSWWNDEAVDGAPLPGIADVSASQKRASIYCPGLLRLKSALHGESYEFKFRDSAGNYDQQVVAALNWFLRCKDGTWQQMDLRTIETLNYVSALFNCPVIQVNSGYRSPEYNAKLAKGNENVARNSLHMFGQAVDFNIPGIPIREVCSYTLYARNLFGYGGVGYYPRNGFVHLDSGKAKQWAK